MRACLLFFLLLPFIARDEPVFRREIIFTSEKFQTDNLGNVFLVNQDVFTKCDAQGKVLKTFTDKKLGEITSADVGNSQRIMLFYRGPGEVVFLDNMLSEVKRTGNLSAFGIDNPWVACLSQERGFWVFDASRGVLFRLDPPKKQPISQSLNLFPLLGKTLNPVGILEQENRVFLRGENGLIYTFDIFGNYLKTLPLTVPSDFQVAESRVYYGLNEPGGMGIYELKSDLNDTLWFKGEGVFVPRLSKSEIYLKYPGKIRIYGVK